MSVKKVATEVQALLSLFWRALFVSPFDRKDTAMLNLLIIAKKGREFNIHALLEYDHALNEEINTLRSRMGARTANFQDELALGSQRLDELFAKTNSENLDATTLAQMKREMDIELRHIRSEWNKWQTLVEDELHSQRDIGGKIRDAWYALTPKDPEYYGDAAEVVEAVIKEREKLKSGWQDLAREQDAFFEKCQEHNTKHLEIDEAWKAISYAQKSVKDERDALRESWLALKTEQEDIVTRFNDVDKGYQKIDEAWKEISYTQKTLKRASKELGDLEESKAKGKIEVPKSADLTLALQEENLKRDYFEKQAGKYMGDITSHFKDNKPSSVETSDQDDINSVLEQIIDITSKSEIVLEGIHPFKLPKRDGEGKIHAFLYQQNVYDFWKWLKDHAYAEVIVIGPEHSDPLWERTLDFLSGKGAQIAHFAKNISVIRRKIP